MLLRRPNQSCEPKLERPASRVELKNVGLTIEGRCILSDITLSLRAKRIGIVGANGSGKSTLARIIAGLTEPTTGSVGVNGVDVCRNRTDAICEVGIIFQNPDHQIIFPTVEEDLAFGPRQQGHSRSEALKLAHAVLDRFDVSDWAEQPISRLSQGQKHLVCLLSVLIMEPAVIIMDEPFTGLDLRTIQILTGILAEFEHTIIHVTHDLATLENYDQVIWIDDGRVGAMGEPNSAIKAYVASIEKSEVGHAVTHLAS